MFEAQPELHFLYAQIAAYNPDRTREEMLAIIRAAGARTAEDAASLEVPVLFIAGEEDIVNSGLEETMIVAYHAIRDALKSKPQLGDLRAAAFYTAINKIALSYTELGVFP